MRKYSSRTLSVGALVSLVIAVALAGGATSASLADENDGVPITVQVVKPTTTPSPRTEVPIVVPVDTPISEAVFPITLSGLEPFSYIEIFANSTPILIASGFADSNGVFAASVKLPSNLPAGDHTISATNTLANGTKISTVAVAFSVSNTGLIASPSAGVDNVSSAKARGASNGSATPEGTNVAEETVTGSAASLALGPDPFNLGGVFYVGGLVAHATYPQGALKPAATISFSVRNVSTEKVSASLHFNVENAFGAKVAEVNEFKLHEFEPGETREITATVENIGQWGIYSAHMTFTPPARVGNNTLTAFELSSGFFALAAWVLIWMTILAGLFTLYVLGVRFLGWPTPAAVFLFIRRLFPGHTTDETTSSEDRESLPEAALADSVEAQL
jgi:hypothetical protein